MTLINTTCLIALFLYVFCWLSFLCSLKIEAARLPIMDRPPVTEAAYYNMNAEVSTAMTPVPKPDVLYKTLSQYAAKGISSCWSRPGRTRNIEVNPTQVLANDTYPLSTRYYEVSTVVSTPDIDKSKLPFNKSKLYLHPVILPIWLRSWAQPPRQKPPKAGETPAQTYYRTIAKNQTHTYYNAGWKHVWLWLFNRYIPGAPGTPAAPVADVNQGTIDFYDGAIMKFKDTVAHEIGHLILNMIFNIEYSHIHKYSSTWGQQRHPRRSCMMHSTGLDSVENDLMKYPAPPSPTSNSNIASENDLRAMISLIKLEAKIGKSTTKALK